MRNKRRDLETEKYVARKQALAIGGGLELDDLLKIIDAKGGDYYKAELNPREGWREAYNHFGMTGKRETLDMQKEIVSEMKQYYGLNGNAATTASTLPAEVKEKYVNDILGYDAQAKYEEILKPRGIVFKNMHPLEEAALFGTAALAVGGTGAAVIGGNNQSITKEELMAMQEEDPNLLVRYA